LHRRFEQRDQRAIFGLAAVAVTGGLRDLEQFAVRTLEQGADAAAARVRVRRAVEPCAPCGRRAVVAGLAQRERRFLARAPFGDANPFAGPQRGAFGQQCRQPGLAGARFQRLAQRLFRADAGVAGEPAAGGAFGLVGGVEEVVPPASITVSSGIDTCGRI
jgi:hypothetical protein